MTIGELARRTGLSPSAIRYYEPERLIPQARRVSGRRAFEEGVLAQLVVVQLARNAGFTIAEVRRLVTEFGLHRWRRMAERKLSEIRSTEQHLQTMTVLLEKLLNCECPDIEFCGRALRRMPTTQNGRAAGPRP